MRLRLLALAIGLAVALPVVPLAQRGNDNGKGNGNGHSHPPPAEDTARVDFGVIPLPPTTPLGPPPCLQTGAIGGPADPCSFLLHHLTPEEVTVRRNGEVTFQIHGGGHGFAIYKVSKNTSRNDIGQYLCPAAPNTDPTDLTDPALHTCNLSAANSGAVHQILDGKNDVVIVAQAGTATHPNNRVWSEPGRLMSIGANQFLPAGTTHENGQLITYQFKRDGRYLIICMNRTHFLNDWMFGFVNVASR